MKAAVLYETKQPLVLEDVDLDEPKAGEVLVRVRRSQVSVGPPSARSGCAAIQSSISFAAAASFWRASTGAKALR